MFCTECGSFNEETARYCQQCGHPLQDASNPVLHQLAAPTYAGFWIRTIALFIDNLICGLLTVLLSLPFFVITGYSYSSAFYGISSFSFDSVMGFSLGTIINWLYFTLLEASEWQATLGKKFVGIQVRNESGQPINLAIANIRYWSKLVSGFILCLGYLMAAFTEKKQALHDKIAATVVIYKP